MFIVKLTNYFIINFQKILGFKNIVGSPYNLFIDPSSICQLRCPFCEGHFRPRSLMKFSDFRNIIDTIGKTAVTLTLANWGEPLLNKETIEMINYASQKYNIFTILHSNFNLNNDEFYKELALSKLNSLTVSLDGASQKTYETYRINGSFDIALNNLKLIVKYKKLYNKSEPFLRWQFLVFRHNEHEIEIAKQMANELLVDELSLPLPAIPPEHSDWSSTISRGKNLFTERTKKKCDWPYTSIVINANGSVSPCCGIPKEEDDFGNIFDSDFQSIWNNSNYRFARKFVHQNITKEDGNVCARCKMKGLINSAPKLLEGLYYSIKPLRTIVHKLEFRKTLMKLKQRKFNDRCSY